MPIGATVARGVEVVAVFAALLAVVGVSARPALAVLTLSAGYLFAIANLTGWVWHDMHLLWLTALLAASPCNDAYAFDARERPGESTVYAWPLLFARLLLGAVYFFPGVHKLASSGLAWALSDNLQHQLYWKWAEHGDIPSFRIDAYPHLLQVGALLVLLFELVAPVLFVVRRTRLFAAVLGVGFHLFAQLFLRIPFFSLWGCYVILLPVRARRSDPTRAEERSLWTFYAVAGILILGAVVQGLRGQMQAFPFACYPTFEWRAGTEMPDLRVVAVMPDGKEVVVPHARDANGYRTQRQWGMVWSLAEAGGVRASSRDSRARLMAYYQETVRAEPLRSLTRGARRIRFFSIYRSVLPEDHDALPLHETLPADVPVGE